jgi:signal transduction histidine kinase
VVDARALGRPVQELLPEYGEADGELQAPEAGPFEIQREIGPESRCYSLEGLALRDWRGLEIGRLILLHDVTGQKQAQAQMVEQQRLRAILEERERLAREMHDSLGQTLAATHLQATTARLFLSRGDTAEADRCLEEMARMSIEAEADVRDYLLGAKTAYSANQPFLPALGLYLARFGQLHGLQVKLSVPPQLEAQGLQPAVEVQLMRIIQEALSNVRKHACAESVRVAFESSDSLLQVTIRDDGRGFDPGTAAGEADGYGLQAMRERAEGLGGCLGVISQPGRGTQVVVEVPASG